ncbi:hypothetical protein RB595_000015 [Gaeumannomyces hyphopodioides]
MSKQQYQKLSGETHIALARDMTFEKALHGDTSANKGGFSSMLRKDHEANQAAADQYFQHWDNRTAKDETAEAREARRTDYASITRQYYNLATDLYEYGWSQSFHFCRFAYGEGFHAAIARHEQYLAHRMGIKRGARVLDVGCGVGGPARQMAKFTGAYITGVNLNEYQVERATRYAEMEGVSDQLRFVQADFMNMPFDENTFDAVYAIEATCHAPTLEGVYSQIYRVLKPGGVFGVYEWVMTDKYDDADLRQRQIRLDIEQGDGIANMMGARDALAAVRAAGFELLEHEDLVVSAGAGNRPATPWYWPLDGSSWRCAQTAGDLFSTLRMTPAGRTVAHAFMWALETLRLAPPGTRKTADSLARAADALVQGGREGLFTPMFLMVARKPMEAS